MATVIDRLVIELGLDPSNFTKGQKAAAAGILKTQQQAQGFAKNLQSAGGKAAEMFSGLRTQVLALGSAFLLGRGVGEFVASVSNADAHIGRMSRQLNVSAEGLTNWMNASKNAGGSADGMKATIISLIEEFQKFGLTGESQIIPLFRSMGLNVADLVSKDGTLTNFHELLLRIADAFQKMPGPRAMAMGHMFGFDEGTINLLMKGRTEVNNLLAAAEKLGNVNKNNTDAAEGLVSAWSKMTQSAETLGRALLTKVSPVLIKLMELVTGLEERFSAWLKSPSPSAEQSNKAIDAWLKSPQGEASILRPGSPAATFADRFGAAFGGGAGSTATMPIPSGSSLLRLKPGASGGGDVSVGTYALATALQNEIPGLSRFTALNDMYHKGTRSKHNEGLALDFTLANGGANAAATAAQIRQKLAAMGIDATVLDEYNNPSANATAGHLHVQFNSRAAAERYAAQAAAANAAAPGSSSTSTQTSTTHVGTIIVNTQAQDAAGVARDLKPHIEQNSFATNANGGLQ